MVTITKTTATARALIRRPDRPGIPGSANERSGSQEEEAPSPASAASAVGGTPEPFAWEGPDESAERTSAKSPS